MKQTHLFSQVVDGTGVYVVVHVADGDAVVDREDVGHVPGRGVLVRLLLQLGDLAQFGGGVREQEDIAEG